MNIIKKIDRALLKNKDFTILSNNCIGALLYHYYGLKFLSPTVNLQIPQNDFIKFCSNLDYYLSLEIEEEKNPDLEWFKSVGGGEITFPVGKLGDISIYFQHYKDFIEAVKDWEKRKIRINKDNIFVVLMDLASNNKTAEDFEKLDCKNKIYLHYNSGIKIKNSFYLKHLEDKKYNYFDRMNKILPYAYYQQFNFTKWLNNNGK